jgi:hypothetical protein
MCSGAESLDVALAAEGVDIVPSVFDGDGVDPNAQSKLDFSKTLAFEDFKLKLSGDDDYRGGGMSFSTINSSSGQGWGEETNSYFSLFDFSAKWDVIPAMLVQNHEALIREFMGANHGLQQKNGKVQCFGHGTKQSLRPLYLRRVGSRTVYVLRRPRPRRTTRLSPNAHRPQSTSALPWLSPDSQ